MKYLMYKLHQIYLYEMNAALNYKKEINVEDMNITFFLFLYKYLVNRGLFLYNYNFVNQGTIIFNLVPNSFFLGTIR